MKAILHGRTAADAAGQPAPRPPLGYLLRQAAAAHRLRMERALADIGVTPPQFLVLRLLAQHVGASNADLSRMASLTTPTVSVIVANLTRRGALASRAHEVHGRVRHLDLTELGTTLLTGCRERAAGVEAELEAGMSASAIASVAAWLRAATTRGEQVGLPSAEAKSIGTSPPHPTPEKSRPGRAPA